MARRLSAMFSTKGDDSISPIENNTPPVPPLPHAAQNGRLQKQRIASGAEMSLNTGVGSPLEPPPTFRETASGGILSKPASRPTTPKTPSSRPSSRRGSLPFGSPSSREGSRSRPQTPTLLAPPGAPASPVAGSPSSPTSAKLAKRKSWLPGAAKADKHKYGDGEDGRKAWIAGLKETITYDLLPLLKGEPIPELWDQNGDVMVHLFPKESGRGPSFKVPSHIFADSRSLGYLAVSAMDSSFQNMDLNAEQGFSPALGTQNYGRKSSMPSIATPSAGLKTVHLPLELEGNAGAPGSLPHGDDLELLVLYRNFFAFLGGGALISTPRQSNLYAIFMGIASIFRRLQFSNADGSSWGEIPTNSFARYCDELRLGDVRNSREKTVEALVLGEQMKYWPLYNEGFVHAAGRYDEIKSINSPKFVKINPITVNRLERAQLDVENRLLILRNKLSDFEFPAMFAGIANSQTATEARLVRFKAWKLAFIDMRKFTLAQYRRRYGSWPPKASSKKNNFEASGFNRLLVRDMYQDFTDLYDMLVNRKELTTRTVDMKPMTDDNAKQGKNETIQHALRTIESEYDRSVPPVLPPIPFDTPMIPAYSQSFRGSNVMASTKDSARRLSPSELNELLLGSYNRESIRPTPWIQEFMAYERKLGSGATLDNMIDYRCGQWLFMYAVLQALPMVAVDARDVKFTEGVEYFLFAAPRGGKPWMREDTMTSKTWYNVSSGGSLISLSGDVLDHQPEGVYRRSHCWLAANQWLGDSSAISQQAMPVQRHSPPNVPQMGLPQQYSPPPSQSPFLEPGRGASPHLSPMHSPVMRPVSPGGSDLGGGLQLPRVASRTSMNMGYEEVAAPQRPSRPTSTYNPSITFDSILGGNDPKGGKKKKK